MERWARVKKTWCLETHRRRCSPLLPQGPGRRGYPVSAFPSFGSQRAASGDVLGKEGGKCVAWYLLLDPGRPAESTAAWKEGHLASHLGNQAARSCFLDTSLSNRRSGSLAQWTTPQSGDVLYLKVRDSQKAAKSRRRHLGMRSFFLSG